MKITIINGNPSPAEFDEYLVHLTACLESRGHKVIILHLRDMRLRHCVGCWGCWVKTPGACAIKDDMAGLLPKVREADVLVGTSAGSVLAALIGAGVRSCELRDHQFGHPVGAGPLVGYSFDYDKGTGADRKLWSMVNKGPYLVAQVSW